MKVGYDPGSAGLVLTGTVAHTRGVASYRAVLKSEAASTFGALLRSGEWKVDESFDLGDVAGEVMVGGDRRRLGRVNAYRFALSADLSIHLDFPETDDVPGEPSGNIHIADLGDPAPALLGKIRGCHEIGVTEPELVLAILRSDVSLDEVRSVLRGPKVTSDLDGIRALGALRDDDLPLRLADDAQSIAFGMRGSA